MPIPMLIRRRAKAINLARSYGFSPEEGVQKKEAGDAAIAFIATALIDLLIEEKDFNKAERLVMPKNRLKKEVYLRYQEEKRNKHNYTITTSSIPVRKSLL